MNDVNPAAEKLTLYNWPTSTCSQKVRIVLAEKSLPFEDRRLDSGRNENLADWYLKLNENGVVPTHRAWRQDHRRFFGDCANISTRCSRRNPAVAA